MMATQSSFDAQVKARTPDWRGRLQKRFRWLRFRFEWGRYCYVVYPIECGVRDFVWWEWELK